MIQNPLSLAIVSTAPSAATEPRHAGDAVTVYHCDFDQAADTNYDAWPNEPRAEEIDGERILNYSIVAKPQVVARRLQQ